MVRPVQVSEECKNYIDQVQKQFATRNTTDQERSILQQVVYALARLWAVIQLKAGSNFCAEKVAQSFARAIDSEGRTQADLSYELSWLGEKQIRLIRIEANTKNLEMVREAISLTDLLHKQVALCDLAISLQQQIDTTTGDDTTDEDPVDTNTDNDQLIKLACLENLRSRQVPVSQKVKENAKEMLTPSKRREFTQTIEPVLITPDRLTGKDVKACLEVAVPDYSHVDTIAKMLDRKTEKAVARIFGQIDWMAKLYLYEAMTEHLPTVRILLAEAFCELEGNTLLTAQEEKQILLYYLKSNKQDHALSGNKYELLIDAIRQKLQGHA